jgi:hypothetical protein
MIQECRHQQEACLKIARAFQLWHAYLKRRRAWWAFGAVVVATAAMVQMLLGFAGEFADAISAVLVLLTVGMVTGYFALHWDLPMEDIGDAAGKFLGLGHRFGHLAAIRPEKFGDELKRLVDSKDDLWEAMPAVPEWSFAEAARPRPFPFRGERGAPAPPTPAAAAPQGLGVAASWPK